MDENPRKVSGRQEPSSCQSCRVKKLRCNRMQPCSNCTVRGITCNFLVPPNRQASTNGDQPNTELLQRIERLEAIINRADSTPSSNGTVFADNPRKRPAEPHHDNTARTNHPVDIDDDFAGIRKPLRQGDRVSQDGTDFHVQILVGSANHSSSHQSQDAFVVSVPRYEIATLLLQNYEADFDPICRILHMPSLKSLLESVYLQANQFIPVAPGQAALLLSIFSMSAFFTDQIQSSDWAASEDGPSRLSKALARTALDVLDYSRRTTHGTLEDIQAYIIMSYVGFHHDGYSPQSRLHIGAAMTLARDLGFYSIDANTEPAEKVLSPRTRLDREMQRRAFWYLTTAEWFAASTSGPQEGIYFIHPKQITVEIPKDCNDDSFYLYEDNCPTSEDRPTSMTYFLERIRLAHICREIADLLPPSTSKFREVPYDHIIFLDRKLQSYLSTLPFYFKLDSDSRQRAKALEVVNPSISLQRFCITRAAHSRRIKMHQRFLLRRDEDLLYGYSRQACLESAKIVMQFYDGLADHSNPLVVTTRMNIAVHYMHLALSVLIMDLCFNRGSTDQSEIKAEVSAGLQMFQCDKHLSPLAGTFLSSLQHTLRKHHVYLNDVDPPQAGHASVHTAQSDSTVDPLLRASDNGASQPDTGPETISGISLAADMSFDDFWQNTVQSGLNTDLEAWDGLLSALDTRPL